MALTRIGCLLVVCAVLATLGAPVLPHAQEARAASVSAPAVAPAAEIDLGGLFGNENESDENEPDEGGGSQADTNASPSSGTSLPVVLLLVLLAALAGAYAAIRVRRLWLRLRGWGRDLRARL